MRGRGVSKTALAPTWTIAEVLVQYPQAASVFTRFRMACVGCPMAPFETLTEAAQAYGLASEAVLQELRGAVTEQMSQLHASSRCPKGRADRGSTHDT